MPSPARANDWQSQHSHHSSFREKLIEHLLIGELLMYSWRHGDCSLEISRPEVDRAGYDLVAEHGRCLRHIQLKGARKGATTAKQKVHLALAEKPSGCVVWAFLDDESLRLGPFLFFGGRRPNLRDVPKRHFRRLDTIEELWLTLFGNTDPRTPDANCWR